MTLKHDEIIKKQIQIYNQAIEKYGDASGAVLLNDQQSQYFRFHELTKNFDFNSDKKTILDVGCGNAELYKYLNFQGFRGKYVGVDINEKLLKQAKSRFKNIEVYKKDIMKENIDTNFDYMVISGLFNLNCGQSLDWIFEFLSKLFVHCNEILAFNLISTYVNFQNKEMFYVEPEKMFSFCVQHLSRRVTLAHNNLPYNYTVLVHKNENWSSVNK
ncbi:MAG TPA: class I SAM-dependent methyltransferase [Candidatus Gastranaerophilaceae bacterium]|nr:class I SAM-dependent methyltransferase [Candidatus Gastranaerophilaceae bacterium]HPT40883.1 class I SAM-dependent methyltransferase [Candidatus Gastranaerophilaceae bacterium]